ncbi:DNA repair protein RadA [Methylovulum psychrotolerans]|jgi:DNA repair protein RadA/Sms|uniref:DNA repair protein RadA n=1 Tax=Methylovulum psychrotolerans TaxID=1704499 RepID=A0A1Z4C177_9GAMM|nr:DNA repair protein RadA [Methylovulum psychrotolerans]ASF47274.1 DNA repair protein RadA [Methylovulum psychrotolerans]MBT9099454.1 DNA repair protein RadA [Methylovulum psychrotolerans]POZ52162.1 DNA repair protein RadA [Methylovulum psychrotolerans]
MSKKIKTAFVCDQCGADYPRWGGQCTSCGEWNTIKEVRLSAAPKEHGNRAMGYAGSISTVKLLSDVDLAQTERILTGITEFDRVLGGGIVLGSVVLIGGAPGAGKSTLLLQAIANIADRGIRVLYVSGEESLQQIAERARRLKLPANQIMMLAETSVQRICEVMDEVKPQILVIDSIQVMHTQDAESAPGSVSQVRESASYLTQYAKRQQVSIFMVGHVTKDQSLAGPMTLSHIVDTQVMLGSTDDARYRVLRADKNRFGSVGELGFFAMDSSGLKEVKNPSAMFLNRAETPASGSVVTVLWEGTRPLLVEIQALVTDCQYGNPRRLAVGFDQNRLAMLLAVLARHGNIMTAQDEIYANVVGGIKVSETGSDLAIVMSVVSSLKNKVIPHDVLFFGEIGLSGEIRPVANGHARLNDAAKHGFKKAVVPKANAPKQKLAQLQVYPVSTLAEALDILGDLV